MIFDKGAVILPRFGKFILMQTNPLHPVRMKTIKLAFGQLRMKFERKRFAISCLRSIYWIDTGGKDLWREGLPYSKLKG